MISKLWQNIIIIVVILLIIICIIYAVFRIQEQNRRSSSTSTTKYRLVWQDLFTEVTPEIESISIDERFAMQDEYDDINQFIDEDIEYEEVTIPHRHKYHSDRNSSFSAHIDQEHVIDHRKDKQINELHPRASSTGNNELRRRILKLSSQTKPKLIPIVNPVRINNIDALDIDDKTVNGVVNENIPADLGEIIRHKTINYGIWNALNMSGNVVGESVGNNDEQSLYLAYTKSTHTPPTLYITDFHTLSLLNIRVYNSITNITSPINSYTSLFNTGSMITRGSFLRGYFTFRLRISSSLKSGGYPFIRLQSYTNSSLNIIHNRYGNWPNSGEIDILEPISYSTSSSGRDQLEWTGKLWFSTQPNPLLSTTINNNISDNINNDQIPISQYQTAVPNTAFRPLKLDKFYDIGVEWLNDRIIWYKRAGMSVTGIPSGKIIGQITADQWWSINSDGKLNPKPAPFDVERNLNLGIATPGTRYSNNGITNPQFTNDATFDVEYIKIYAKTTTTTTSTTTTTIT